MLNSAGAHLRWDPLLEATFIDKKQVSACDNRLSVSWISSSQRSIVLPANDAAWDVQKVFYLRLSEPMTVRQNCQLLSLTSGQMDTKLKDDLTSVLVEGIISC